MVDAADFRKIMSHYPTGVCAITSAQHDGTPIGLIVGSFSSVSLDPPLVGFFPDRSSATWPLIEQSGRFFINILGSDQQGLCAQLCRSSSARFDDIDYALSDLGSPRLAGVIAGIDCELHQVTEAGDHFLVLGLVRSMDLYRDADPMLFLKGQYGGFNIGL